MPFITSWATADQRLLLTIGEPVITVFRQHVQLDPSDREAGGLLLGTVHGTNIAVSEATAPTAWDIRLRYFFERLPFGHRSVAFNRWNASGGTVRYLGEWHTHPEDDPHPSGLDRSEWRIISKQRIDRRPLLVVIVGRRSLHVELVPTEGMGSILLPVS